MNNICKVRNYRWQSVKFRTVGDGYAMEVVDAEGKKSTINLGFEDWAMSQLAGYPHYSILAKNRFSGVTGPFYTGSCYAWNGETLEAKIHYVNWITALRLSFKFDGNNVEINVSENYPSKPFVIQGKRK